MARVPQRGTFQPGREGQDLQREGQSRDRVIEGLSRRIETLEAQALKVGAIALFSTEGPPGDGWLEANGQLVGRIKYRELFELWGTAYGAGDTRTTYDLPTIAAPATFVWWIFTGVFDA